MNDKGYVAVIVLIAAAQLLLCWKAKRRIVKWIPVLLIIGLMLGCVVAYALSGWTNWAFLILILLLAGVLMAAAVTWAAFAIIRSIAKWAGKGQ